MRWVALVVAVVVCEAALAVWASRAVGGWHRLRIALDTDRPELRPFAYVGIGAAAGLAIAINPTGETHVGNLLGGLAPTAFAVLLVRRARRGW